MLKKRKSLFIYELAITKEAVYKSLGFTVVYRRWLRWPRIRLSGWRQAKSKWVPFELLNPSSGISILRGAYFTAHEHALLYVGEVQLSGKLRLRRGKHSAKRDQLPSCYDSSATTRFKFDV